MSEKTKEEIERKFRLELSEADPSNPFTGHFTDEHREEIEKRFSEKYNRDLSDAYEDCIKKA